MSTGFGKHVDSDDTGKGRKDIEHCDVTPLLAFDVFLEVHGGEDGEADDKAIGDLKECRDQLRVPEAFDDEGAEIAH